MQNPSRRHDLFGFMLARAVLFLGMGACKLPLFITDKLIGHPA